MRPIDFIVFYTMANFRRRWPDEQLWKKQLSRFLSVASINVGLVIGILCEVIGFLIFKINIADFSNAALVLAFFIIFIYVILYYIYINKKRYEYITSPHYKSFSLSVVSGAMISFLVFLLLMIAVVGVAVDIHHLITK